MIRRALTSDLKAVLPLIRDHAIYERSPLPSLPTPSLIEAALFAPTPALRMWVAVNEGAVVGYASGSVGYSTWRGTRQFQLDCLYLAPQARGLGFGKALMHAVATEARAEDCAFMEWLTPSWNDVAIGFYAALGAQQQQRERFKLWLT